MKNKICSPMKGCGELKPVSKFYYDKKRKVYSTNCRECTLKNANSKYNPTFGYKYKSKECVVCKVKYSSEDKNKNFDTYAGGKYWYSYCKKPECKKEFSKLQAKANKKYTDKKREEAKLFRLNIIRAKFVAWGVEGGSFPE